MKKQLSQQAQVAKLIRQDLKARGIPARVTSESYSMGNNVNVAVTDIDPKTFEELEKAYAKYQYGHFDGMTDMYEYSNSRDDIPQTKYLFVRNEISDEMKQRIWDFLRGKFTGNFGEMPASYEEARNLRDGGFEAYVSDIVYRYFRGAYQYGDFWEQGDVKDAA